MIPEILAPAGNYEAFLAAIENGADAVYLGGTEFNARYHADNFEYSDIERALEYAHVRGKKVYITLNIMLGDQEIPRALDYAFELQRLGADAVIVQDLGLLKSLTSIFPDLRVHASTQMTVHNDEGVRMLVELGACRVVLARELGAEDISYIRSQCPDAELEVFVHGALCYSYSGQCLLSSVVGGRSGNRGRCAQPCRLRYRLMEEGNQVHSGYLLSPADLCLLSEIPRLVNLGVASLKIEGRMKRPEYVAVVTRVFRRAIDRLLEYRANGKADEWKPTLQETRELHSIFNRTFTSNQWSGKNLNVLSVDRPDNRGVLVGQVVKTYPRDSMVDIRLDCELHTGDGIEIRTRQGTNPATIVENIYGNGRRLETAEPGDIINIEVRGKCRAGDSVYRTRDRVLIDEARQTIVENREESKVPISVQVKARIGKSMQLSFSDPQGHKGIAYTETAVMAARNRPLTETDIIDKLDRLGNTPWKPVSWDLDLDPGIMIPFSELNEARRAAGDKLKDQILDAAKPPSISREVFSSRVNQIIKEHGTSQALEDSKDTGKGLQNQTVRLSIRVPSVQTARAALESEVDRVYLSLLGIKGAACTGEEIKELQDIANGGDKELFLEVPAILRPGEKFDFTRIRDLNPDGILVGNPGALRQMHRWGIDIQADYTFNTFNSMTVEVLAQYGVKGVCLSPELNRTQLKRLVTLSMPLEYIVHGQLQVMISEHCIAGNLGFCSRDCHQTNRVLKDDKGYEFPLATDRYCRLHVFNSRTTCLIEQLGELSRMGIKYFRIESLLDNVDQVKQTIYAYRQAIHVIEGREKVKLSCLRKELEAIAQSPLTSLHLKRGIQ